MTGKVTQGVQSKEGRARQFGMGINVLLREGLALWHARRDLAPEDFQIRHRELDEKLTHQLRNRILQDDDNQRLLNGIGTQHDRGNLLRFLETEGVEPTNNRAERMLRPAVIARKVSHFYKNQSVANPFYSYTSIAQNDIKNGAATVTTAFRSLFSTFNADSVSTMDSL